MKTDTEHEARTKADTEFVEKILKKNPDAINIVSLVTRGLNVWSSLERGVAMDPARARVGMWGLLIGLPANKFYQQHFSRLSPIVTAICLDLVAASDIEKKPKLETLYAAFGARQSWALLLQQLALIVGGNEWAMVNAGEIRTFACSQSFSEYLLELAPAAAEALA